MKPQTYHKKWSIDYFLWYVYFMALHKDSVTYYLLTALIPYSDANLKLAFKPNMFFDDLERISKKSRKYLTTSYSRALKNELVELDVSGVPKITDKARRELAPFKSQYIKYGSLMVIYDIPENDRLLRNYFRSLLKEFYFWQVQKSVWVTNLDCVKYIKDEVKKMNLQNEVKIFECQEIS